jgi:hypothetical protein
MIKTERQYYYLIAGLPEIHFGSVPAHVRTTEIIAEIKESIAPDDIPIVNTIYFPNDNYNLINYCQKKNNPWKQPSNFSPEDFKKAFNEGDDVLPVYMVEFYTRFVNGNYQSTEILPENILTGYFYEYVFVHFPGFLSAWFEFDRDFRNILAALSAGYQQISPDFHLIGDNEVVGMIKNNRAFDFGLSFEFPYINQLIRLHEQHDYTELEKLTDQIRWNKTEEITAFSYFTLDSILGYLIKLEISSRWAALNTEEGVRLLDIKINQLRQNIRFTDEYVY